MLKPTVFSFDFDNTISRDPSGFMQIMKLLRDRGHDVYVCTMRMKWLNPEDFDFLIEAGYKVFFTEHKAKDEYMKSQGIQVDVWVDDLPDSIIEDWHGVARTFRTIGA